MTETAHVRKLRKAISGDFYFGVMCHDTRRRIAISIDESEGKQRYSHSGETVLYSLSKKSPVRQSRHILFPAGWLGMTVSATSFLRGV